MIEISVPELGESIQEVQVSQWLKKEGEWVAKDEDVVELETEKASQALSAPESGVIGSIKVGEGEFAKVGDVLALMEKADAPVEVAAGNAGAGNADTSQESDHTNGTAGSAEARIMPAAQRMLHEYKISAEAIKASGPGGRLLKEDVQAFIEKNNLTPGGTKEPVGQPPQASSEAEAQWVQALSEIGIHREEQVKPMSMIRRTIASRLVEAQQTAALLTTFNEIDMEPVMSLRKKYKESFQEKHGVKLGFMSFFAKAAVEALKRFPAINSEVRGNEVVSRNYHDIGVAIGGGKGLVVPVVRNVERISFADIERQIGRFASLAMDNKIKPADLEGGTFTISNGGVYGSLLSTPIVNPPQSGILGLHSIQERPMAVNGQVVIRPMMYIALTYDHRIVDGREAVGFLRTIKEVLEEPARLFLEV